VEKKFKAKQAQEAYVSKAREKYNGDCIRITSYTQQSTFAQGKDLERIQFKLKRAQQTVQANEKDFASFTEVLVDMMPGWEADWKGFCDTCQDLEEDRMEFMKDILWTYANLVSTICVSDDEVTCYHDFPSLMLTLIAIPQSCERIRTALECFGTERDVAHFVSDYGTGNLIPEPRSFVPFNGKDMPSSSSTTPPTHPANFIRISNRTAAAYPSLHHAPQAEHLPPPDEPATQVPQANGKTHKRSTCQSSQPSRSRGNSTSTNRSPPRPSDTTALQAPPPELHHDAAQSKSRRSLRQSTPLPIPGIHQSGQQENPPAMPPLPPSDRGSGERILFYGAYWSLCSLPE